MLLAIDPGTHTGWAVFGGDRRLKACGVGDPRSSHWTDLAKEVVVEKPRIYPSGRTSNPNDVLTLAVKAGEWAGRFDRIAKVRYVEPSEWKGGSVRKDIQNARDRAKLTPGERAIVDATGQEMSDSTRHNMLDAIGIGLFGVGRG